MLKKFFKYQSLGNDFILFDWYKKSENSIQKVLSQKSWNQFVVNLCNRNFGIGADGILILKTNLELQIPEALIFNSDGTQAEICLNGLRSINKHLFTYHNLEKEFQTKMGSKIIDCFTHSRHSHKALVPQGDRTILLKNNIEIINKIKSAEYIETRTIDILGKKLIGHVIDLGNPHFVIFEETNLDWLKKHGHLLEKHKSFTNKTNVEFVWKDKKANHYNMLVYERGCGITLACSSGVASTLWALFYLNKIKKEEKITIQMPGGQISCWIDKNQKITLQSTAQQVFKGSL